MASFSVQLPLAYSVDDGYMMITTIKNVIKQNFKMLVLTNPGERVMNPRFGVGIEQYLFENFQQGTLANIDSKIREQAAIYLPAISILAINFGNIDPDNNHLGIYISYSIPTIAAKDLLEFTI